MNIHFVYASVTLPYIYESCKDDKRNNLIVVFNQSHYQFLCDHLFNVVIAGFNPNKLYNPFEILKGFLFFKQYVFSVKSSYVFIRLYHISFTGVLFFLLQFLWSNRFVVMVQVTSDIYREQAMDSLKAVLFKLFGLDVEIVSYGDGWYPRLTEEYVQSRYQYGEYVLSSSISSTYLFDETVDTVFILDDLVIVGIMDEDELVSVVETTMEHLVDAGCSVVVKCHPDTSPGFAKLFHYRMYPQSVPFELIDLQHIVNVVGVNSTCMIHAAKQGVNTVSVIDCCSSYDMLLKQSVKQWMKEESQGRICFISSFDELRGVLVV